MCLRLRRSIVVESRTAYVHGAHRISSRLVVGVRGGRGRVTGEGEEDVVEGLAAGLRLQLGRCALGDQPAAVEQPDHVGELVGLLEVLRGEEDRHAVGEQLADDLPQVAATARVEAGGRLVEEDQPGPADQRHREVEPALHAAGVGRRLAGRRRRPGRSGRAARRPGRRPRACAGGRGRPSAAGSRARSAARRWRRTGRSHRSIAVRRRARGGRRSRRPVASPASAVVRVDRMRTMVVLPAPLGPEQGVDGAGRER